MTQRLKNPKPKFDARMSTITNFADDQTDVENFWSQIWSKSGFDLACQSDLELKICSRILKNYFFNFEEKTRKFPILFLSPGPPDGGVINNILVQ